VSLSNIDNPNKPGDIRQIDLALYDFQTKEVKAKTVPNLSEVDYLSFVD